MDVGYYPGTRKETMMSSVQVGAQAVMEESHRAWAEFVKGSAERAKALFSTKDDVTLGNPFGPFVRGWKEAEATIDRAATVYRDGEVVGFETVSTYSAEDLACYVENERYRAKIGGGSELSLVALRVTTVLRREDDGWRIVHRHADPITTPRPAKSVIQD
jgi:ketosteroid isomerase-like protein